MDTEGMIIGDDDYSGMARMMGFDAAKVLFCQAPVLFPCESLWIGVGAMGHAGASVATEDEMHTYA